MRAARVTLPRAGERKMGHWMEHDPNTTYDSFVVRLWHEPESGRLLRAEINHVQTGAVFVGRTDVRNWILATLDEAVSGRAHPGRDDAPKDDPG